MEIPPKRSTFNKQLSWFLSPRRRYIRIRPSAQRSFTLTSSTKRTFAQSALEYLRYRLAQTRRALRCLGMSMGTLGGRRERIPAALRRFLTVCGVT
ncbi:hypothetical protein DPMN_175272 [Dreissena polymorpha]|uniref:Uncharacterized protein n=1 Tax=Dreissena polymorpha TaxID=45954 RepID=A0A9D4IFW3_DREPO|nr:hypothetical protein DPMN_175272 [Dreissena polymorpha]